MLSCVSRLGIEAGLTGLGRVQRRGRMQLASKIDGIGLGGGSIK